MLDPSCSPLDPGIHPAVRIPPAALRAYLALVGGLGGVVTALLLLTSIAANSGIEAERITEARGVGYAPTLVGALAVHFSSPSR